MELHEKIKHERLKQGLTQTELSELTGIRQAAISQFENSTSSLTSKNIDKLLKELNINID